jgi:hypothetical protein
VPLFSWIALLRFLGRIVKQHGNGKVTAALQMPSDGNLAVTRTQRDKAIEAYRDYNSISAIDVFRMKIGFTNDF